MTTLLLDLGNTRWKIARAEEGEIGEVVSGPYDDAEGLDSAMREASDGVNGLLIASVVDSRIADQVVAVVSRRLMAPVRRLTATDPMPNLVSGYRKPDQLGVDRLLAMVAARARSSHPLCVVDAGTAVTVDFIDAHGQHLGGFIMPGMRMSRECLLAHTSIPRDPDIEEGVVLGRDTATGVALGARNAVAGVVERFTIGSAALFHGQAVETFVGGGDAESLLGLLPPPCIRLDHMVLRGLAVVAASGDY